MQIVSAYLLAASAVDSGNYDEYYDLWTDPQFEEYMDIAGDDIIGDYVEINPPTDGGGNVGDFSGDQFCGKWLSAFTRPLEYIQIYAQKAGVSVEFPSAEIGSNWSGFKVNYDFDNPQYDGVFIPTALDDQVMNNSGKHINFWLATFSRWLGGGENEYQAALFGMYVGENVSFKCVSNQPSNGFASFSVNNYIGTNIGIGTPKRYTRNWVNGAWGEHGGHSEFGETETFILVYNVNGFKNYLNNLSTEACEEFIRTHLFLLGECNVSTKKV